MLSTVLYFTFLIHEVAACEWGKHGENCDKRCSKNCQVNPQRNRTHCNKETGECSDGCIPGWYATQCDQPCSKNCLDNVCSHQNGQCTKGCSGKKTGDFCEITEVSIRTHIKVTTDETTGLSKAHVAVIITILLVAIIVIIVVTVVIKRRRQRRTLTGRPTGCADPENPEGVPLLPTILKRETEQVFVVTALYNNVKTRLEKFRHVTISGAAGEGKTSMALMLGSEYQKEGYELYFVDNISQFKLSVVSQDKDQCFIFDDIFGTVGMSTDSRHLGQVLHHLNFCLEQKTSTISEKFLTNTNHRGIKHGKTLIIFTTKSYNLRQGISHLKEKYQYVFFKGASVIDLTQTQYTVNEKRQMFLKHKDNMKYDCDLEEICGIKDNMFGFPLTCKLFFIFLKSHKQYKQTLWAPFTYLRRELEVLLSKMNNESAALILMLLCDGELNMRHLEIKSSNQVLEDHLSIVSSVVNNFNRAKVITCVRDFFGTYFTKGDITRFSHPSIYDACAIVLYEINPAFVLQHCSIRFLYERVQAQTVPACETDEDRHVIYVSDAYNDIIASRLAGAIKHGNFRMSVMHPILERQDIVDKVIDELKPFLSHTSVTDEHGNTMFHYAYFSGNIYLVGKLIPFCDINSKVEDGVRPRGISVLLGLEDLQNLLVSKEADLTMTDDYNNNVLHLACEGGKTLIVEYLLPMCDINCRGYNGWTPVMKGAYSGNKDTFDLLLLNGANPSLTGDDNDTLLHAASRGGNIDIVKHVIGDFDINTRGGNGHTPLMQAVCGGHTDVVDFLVDQGADVNMVDNDGDSLLHLACEKGNLKMVKHVMSYSDINLRDNFGWTPLAMAAVEGKLAVFKYLKGLGADLTLADRAGDDVYTLALQGGSRGIIKELGLEEHSGKSITPWNRLMKALVTSQTFYLNTHSQQSPDLVQTDQYGDSLLHLACRGGNKEFVEYLLPSYDINVRGRYNWTPVMMAAVCGHGDVFQLLVSHKADLSLVSKTGEGITTLARRGNNNDIIKYVLNHC